MSRAATISLRHQQRIGPLKKFARAPPRSSSDTCARPATGFNQAEGWQSSRRPKHKLGGKPLSGSQSDNTVGIRIIAKNGREGDIDAGAGEIDRRAKGIATTRKREPSIRAARDSIDTSPTQTARAFSGHRSLPGLSS